MLAAWKTVVQLLQRQVFDQGLSPNLDGQHGEKLALAPCTAHNFFSSSKSQLHLKSKLLEPYSQYSILCLFWPDVHIPGLILVLVLAS